jgi:hypothetical protein
MGSQISTPSADKGCQNIGSTPHCKHKSVTYNVISNFFDTLLFRHFVIPSLVASALLLSFLYIPCKIDLYIDYKIYHAVLVNLRHGAATNHRVTRHHFKLFIVKPSQGISQRRPKPWLLHHPKVNYSRINGNFGAFSNTTAHTWRRTKHKLKYFCFRIGDNFRKTLLVSAFSPYIFRIGQRNDLLVIEQPFNLLFLTSNKLLHTLLNEPLPLCIHWN